MRAMLLTQTKRLELADMPEPVMTAGDVLVRVRACGICGSDVHGYDGSTGRRIPPLIMGHEAAGVVERVGKDVRRFAPGDRVTFDSMISCGECRFCTAGTVNLCDNRRVLGVSCGEYRRHGAFAEWVAVPEHIVYAMPDGLSFEHAAMVEPVSVAVHAVNLTTKAPGDTAVVVGCGMIGLLCVQALRALGCGDVYAVDPDSTRRERALALGAREAFDSSNTDVPAEVRSRTAGHGADLALEAVGAAEPIETAIACVRKGGAVTLVGNIKPHVAFPLQSVVTRELQVRGSCGSNADYPQCLALMASGAIDVSSLITATVPLEEGPGWFERLYNREPGLMKVVLQP